MPLVFLWPIMRPAAASFHLSDHLKGLIILTQQILYRASARLVWELVVLYAYTFDHKCPLEQEFKYHYLIEQLLCSTVFCYIIPKAFMHFALLL